MAFTLSVGAALTALCYVHLLVLRCLKRVIEAPRRIGHPLLFIHKR